MRMKMIAIPIIVDILATVPKGLKETLGGIENQRKNHDYTDHNIVSILKRILKIVPATQTSVKTTSY